MSPNFIPTIVLLSLFLTAYTWWLVFVYLDSPCSEATLAQYSRLSRHCTALTHQEVYHSAHTDNRKSHFWAPTWSCPLAEEIGHSTDMTGGSKWVCDVDHIDSDCIVYSFGTTTNYSFELEMNTKFGCEVHVFDPFVPVIDRERNVLHHLWNSNNNYRLGKFAEIVRELDHKHRDIDVVSFNVHGCELDILKNPIFWSELNEIGARIDQIIVTVINAHEEATKQSMFCQSPPKMSLQALHELFQFFSRSGYAVFHREYKHDFVYYHSNSKDNSQPHVEIPPPGSVIEFSFVRLDYNCESKVLNGNSKYVSF